MRDHRVSLNHAGSRKRLFLKAFSSHRAVCFVSSLCVALCLTSTGYARSTFWYRLAQCEEHGAWHQRGTSFVGGLGIYGPNWDQWAPAVGVHVPAWQATPAEQIRVAKYGRRVDHAYWGCFATVGMPPSG